jgi:hypothetical protein
MMVGVNTASFSDWFSSAVEANPHDYMELKHVCFGNLVG